MSDLSKLPNIGKELDKVLQQVGITSVSELKNAGAENAFIRLKAVDDNACLNKLFAIEGAIQGIRWHLLKKSRMEELKDFFNNIR